MRYLINILCIALLLAATGCAITAKGDASVTVETPDPFAEFEPAQQQE